MYKYVLFLAIIAYSCNVKSNDFEQRYLNAKAVFPSKFVNHFPDVILSKILMYSIDTNTTLHNISFFLEEERLPQQYFDSIVSTLNKNVTVKYNADDSGLFVVNKFTTKDNYRDYYKYPDNYEFDLPDTIYTQMPVPNFFNSRFADIKSQTRLDSTFVLYTIECEKGVHWGEFHIQQENYMPEYWKHGYSKGIAVSEEKQVIIFWFINW